MKAAFTLTVYDIPGQETAVLLQERKAAGRHRIAFDGSRIASGVYFCLQWEGKSKYARCCWCVNKVTNKKKNAGLVGW